MDGAKMAVIRAICDHAAAKAQMAKSEAILGLHPITPDEAKVDWRRGVRLSA
jgi:hypothetical protein